MWRNFATRVRFVRRVINKVSRNYKSPLLGGIGSLSYFGNDESHTTKRNSNQQHSPQTPPQPQRNLTISYVEEMQKAKKNTWLFLEVLFNVTAIYLCIWACLFANALLALVKQHDSP